MTLGKIYYLAGLFGRINFLGPTFATVSFVFLVIFTIFDSEYKNKTEEYKKWFKKTCKGLGAVFCLSLIISIATPSREDFLVMSITKDYTPQQIYKMTKEEMKDNIDYLIKQIKEIK